MRAGRFLDFTPRTVRGTILLTLLIVLIPMLVVQGAIYYRWLEVRRAQEYQANLELSRAVSAAFGSYVQGVVHEELALGRALTSPQPLSPPQSTRLLAEAAQEYPSVRHFAWVDPKGDVLASAFPEAVGIDLSDRDYFREVVAGKQWAVSDLLTGRATGEVTFGIARGIRDESGNLLGIVLATVDPSHLDEVLPVGRADQGAIALLDRQGTVVFRYPSVPLTWEQHRARDNIDIVTRALVGEEVAGTFVSLIDGKERIAGLVPIRSIGWVASGNRPVAEATAPMMVDLLYDLGMLVLVGLVALVGALALGRNLTVPLDRLRGRALAIGRGELGSQVVVSGPAELEELGDAFNRMSKEVLAREADQSRLYKEAQFDRARWRATVESMLDPVTVSDAEGHAIYMNAAYSRLVNRHITAGVPLEEHAVHYQLFHPDGTPFDPAELPLQRAALRNEEVRNVELVQRTADGDDREMVWSASPMHDSQGAVVGAVAVGRDVTHQRQLEADRQRSEETQHFLAEAGALLAASLDVDTVIASIVWLVVPRVADGCAVDLVERDGKVHRKAVSRSWEDPEGLTRGPEAVYPIDPGAEWGPSRVLQSGRPELYTESPDGLLPALSADEWQLKIFQGLGVKSVLLAPMLAGGRTMGVLILVSSRNGRSFGSAELSLAEDLARRAAVAVDNARLYQETREAVRVRNEFFSSLSHDLKNPLTAIKGMAQLMNRQLSRSGGSVPQSLPAGLGSIDSMATKMSAQIDELLDVARLQSGQRMDLSRRPTELVALARRMTEEHQQGTDQHTLRFISTEESMVGEWDPTRLERVLANLLSNAMKYSPGGGEILVSVSREDDEKPCAILKVNDQGLGIPAADLPHIFDGFHRAGNVVGRFVGTGIGLASTRQIVELHGGTIGVSSVEGAGSTFTVRLPLWAVNGQINEHDQFPRQVTNSVDIDQPAPQD